jgi:hypothetical protein
MSSNAEEGTMMEQELYDRVVAIREEVCVLLDGITGMPATIELCVFTGHLCAAVDYVERQFGDEYEGRLAGLYAARDTALGLLGLTDEDAVQGVPPDVR